jgi:hypothetical protein
MLRSKSKLNTSPLKRLKELRVVAFLWLKNDKQCLFFFVGGNAVIYERIGLMYYGPDMRLR